MRVPKRRVYFLRGVTYVSHGYSGGPPPAPRATAEVKRDAIRPLSAAHTECSGCEAGFSLLHTWVHLAPVSFLLALRRNSVT